MAKSITRTLTFPIDLYDVLKNQAKKEEIHISQLVIKALREYFNVPVKIEDN